MHVTTATFFLCKSSEGMRKTDMLSHRNCLLVNWYNHSIRSNESPETPERSHQYITLTQWGIYGSRLQTQTADMGCRNDNHRYNAGETPDMVHKFLVINTFMFSFHFFLGLHFCVLVLVGNLLDQDHRSFADWYCWYGMSISRHKIAMFSLHNFLFLHFCAESCTSRWQPLKIRDTLCYLFLLSGWCWLTLGVVLLCTMETFESFTMCYLKSYIGCCVFL